MSGAAERREDCPSFSRGSENRAVLRTAAKAVVFDGHQALSIARGFAHLIQKSDYRVYACSILPEHVRLVLGRHAYRVGRMVRRSKAEASAQAAADGRHPLARWSRPDGSLPTRLCTDCWKVFLDGEEDVRRRVRYVDNNPVKEGKRARR